MHKPFLESTQGKWIGDVGLNDGAVQECHSQYMDRVHSVEQRHMHSTTSKLS